MITNSAIQAAITAIKTGIVLSRENLARFDAECGRLRPRQLQEAQRMEAEIEQMEAALDGLRGGDNQTDEKGRPMTYWGGTP
jgi:hypothetical protein